MKFTLSILLKEIVFSLILLTTLLNFQCKKETFSCIDVEVGKVNLIPESNQFLNQHKGKTLIYKDSVGNEIGYIMQSIDSFPSITALRLENCNSIFKAYIEYISVESRRLTLDRKPYWASNLNLFFWVSMSSEGLPPNDIHYDIFSVNDLKVGGAAFQLSKRVNLFQKDLALGNRVIGDTSLLGRPFKGVYENIYKASNYVKISSIVLSSIPNLDDFYSTTQQSIVAFKLNNDKLWVLDCVECPPSV